MKKRRKVSKVATVGVAVGVRVRGVGGVGEERVEEGGGRGPALEHRVRRRAAPEHGRPEAPRPRSAPRHRPRSGVDQAHRVLDLLRSGG